MLSTPRQAHQNPLFPLHRAILTLLLRQRREVQMDSIAVRFPRSMRDEDEPPTRIARYSYDLPHAQLPAFDELILAPGLALVRGEQNVICRFLVVRHDEDATGIAEFPKVGVLQSSAIYAVA